MPLDHVGRGARSPRREGPRRARRAARRLRLADHGAGDLDEPPLVGARACRPARRGRRRAPRTRSLPARPRGARRGRPLECSCASATLPSHRQLLDRLLGLERPAQAPARAPEVRHRAAGRRRTPGPSLPAGSTKPLSTLKKVVLPAPLGPISPQVPDSNVTDMASSGVTPPKRTVRSRTSITTPAPLRDCRVRRRADQAAEPVRSFGTCSTRPAGAVSSTCRMPTPNRIVSRSAGRPQLSSSAGSSLIREARDDRAPEAVDAAHQHDGQQDDVLAGREAVVEQARRRSAASSPPATPVMNEASANAQSL